MPLMPFAPGRFSTTTCWPHASVSFWVIGLHATSTAPPAAWGMMTRTGRAGYGCASAASAMSAAQRRKAEGRRRKVCMHSRRLQGARLAGAQDVHQAAHGLEVLELGDRGDGFFDA